MFGHGCSNEVIRMPVRPFSSVPKDIDIDRLAKLNRQRIDLQMWYLHLLRESDLSNYTIKSVGQVFAGGEGDKNNNGILDSDWAAEAKYKLTHIFLNSPKWIQNFSKEGGIGYNYAHFAADVALGQHPLYNLYVLASGKDYKGETQGAGGKTLAVVNIVTLGGASKLKIFKFADYNLARNAALEWLTARGFKAEAVVLGKFGPNAGKPIGMQSLDGKIGFRVEYDARSGAHINVWFGKEKGPHFEFEATEEMVNNIVKRFIK